MGKGNIKSDGSYFSHMDYAQTFRRLEKQFENLARSSKPTKRDIEATTVPAGRTLYSVIRKGFLDCLSPPDWLRSETLLPGLVDEEKQPKFDKWKPDEYSVYWVFAMQWLPTANMTSVPNNAGLQWSKWKWSKEQQRAVRVTFDNETDYIKHLQACATMYGEACNLIAGILDTTPAKRRRIIGWIFKKTSHFICALIIAVVAAIIAAVVVDIFADFGWLESIKRAIYNILTPK